MSEYVEVDSTKSEVSVFGIKASVHGKRWSLLRPGYPVEVVEEKMAQQVVSFLNKHAMLPQGAVLHLDAGRAALLAVQDADFCAALVDWYKTPKVPELHVGKVAFRTKRTTFRLPVRVHDVRNLLEARTVSGKPLLPLS